MLIFKVIKRFITQLSFVTYSNCESNNQVSEKDTDIQIRVVHFRDGIAILSQSRFKKQKFHHDSSIMISIKIAIESLLNEKITKVEKDFFL